MTSMVGRSGVAPSGQTRGALTGGNKVPRGYEQGQLQQFTPEQMQLFQQLFQHVGPESFLSQLAGGNQESFEALEQPAMRQFSALQGNLASRFSGMGSGARRSSGFQNTANQATQDFASQLQSQRLGIQRNALQDLMGISSELLGQRPYEQFLSPKKKSFLQELLLSLAPAASQAAGQFGGMALAGL